MLTVIIGFSQLPACSLGCYGEWNISTPEFDAIASRSLVFDNYFVSPGWQSLLELLVARIPASSLIHGSNPDAPVSSAMTNVLTLPVGEIPDQAQLEDFLQRGVPALLFIDFRPLPAGEAAVADEVKRWSEIDGQLDVMEDDESGPSPTWRGPLMEHAVEAQRCDAALAHWLELLEEVMQPDDILVLTATSGDARRISDDRPDWLKSVSEPLVHLPLIVHRVDQESQVRVSEFVGMNDAIEMIATTFPQHPDGLPQLPSRVHQDRIEYTSRSACGTRLRDWLLVEHLLHTETEAGSQAKEPEVRLFHKPEDIWEMNDVAPQFPEKLAEIQSRDSGARH